MIAGDTNVLGRLFVSDTPEQARAAGQLVTVKGDAPRSIYGSDVVLAEFVWVPTARIGWAKARVLAAVAALTADPRVAVDDRGAIETAMMMAGDGKPDVADEFIAAIARARGASTTYTFDKDARSEPGFTLVPAVGD